jgi:glycosyltransferase involved in cell wall biosynthesis|tara:strand:+ start:1318 stop:2463 length:1146 start_codon:yes stop_codon:yes gene_type:complete
MKVYYWSPFSSNIATIQAVLRSAESLSSFGSKFEPYLINSLGEWNDLSKEKKFTNIINLTNINIAKFLNNKGFLSSRIIIIITFFFCFFKLKKLLDKDRPEFIIIHLVSSLPLILLLLFKFKTKFILRISGYPKLNLFRRILWRLVAKKISLVTSPSISTLKHLINKKIFRENNIKVLYDPVFKIREIPKLKKNNEFKFDDNYKYLISIGRFTKQKNFEYLIKEFSLISKKYTNYKLILIGNGELKEKLAQLINKLNLSEKVIMTGYKKNVFEYFAKSEVFVMTSYWEDPGFVLIESAISNVNIISGNCPNGPKDFFENNENMGFKLETYNEGDLLKTFEEFIKSSVIKKNQKKLNAKIYAKKYSYYYHFKKLNALLDSLN